MLFFESPKGLLPYDKFVKHWCFEVNPSKILI